MWEREKSSGIVAGENGVHVRVRKITNKKKNPELVSEGLYSLKGVITLHVWQREQRGQKGHNSRMRVIW